MERSTYYHRCLGTLADRTLALEGKKEHLLQELTHVFTEMEEIKGDTQFYSKLHYEKDAETTQFQLNEERQNKHHITKSIKQYLKSMYLLL